jgi:hypothetical protein
MREKRGRKERGDDDDTAACKRKRNVRSRQPLLLTLIEHQSIFCPCFFFHTFSGSSTRAHVEG